MRWFVRDYDCLSLRLGPRTWSLCTTRPTWSRRMRPPSQWTTSSWPTTTPGPNTATLPSSNWNSPSNPSRVDWWASAKPSCRGRDSKRSKATVTIQQPILNWSKLIYSVVFACSRHVFGERLGLHRSQRHPQQFKSGSGRSGQSGRLPDANGHQQRQIIRRNAVRRWWKDRRLSGNFSLRYTL